MKVFFTVLPMWFLACLACAVNSLEREFLCPICGTRWSQRVETSGTSRGLRLDLRQLGDVQDPPTLPQCTKCRFPLFSESLIEQAKDPAKAMAFKHLRTFVLGADFQMLAAKNPPYFALALVQGMNTRNPTPHRYLALSYLRASWQVEDRDAACRRLLEKAHEHYAAALEETSADDRQRADFALLCGEIERRLGKWDAAENRFRALEESKIFEGTPKAGIPALQLRLIAAHDSAPHPIEGPEVVENHPRPDREMRLENPGSISLASGRVEKPAGMKLGSPPTTSEELLPTALVEAPAPSLRLDSASVENPDGRLMLGSPQKVAEEPAALLTTPTPPAKSDPSPVEKPDDIAKPVVPPKPPEERPVAPPQPPAPPIPPDPASIEKLNGVTKPILPSKAQSIPGLQPAGHAVRAKAPNYFPPPPAAGEWPVALPPLPLVLLPFVPFLPLAAPVKPDSNFSDNPD